MIDDDYEEHLLTENLNFPANKFVTREHNGLKFYSQIMQDLWVCETLQYKREGTFVDLGCRGPIAHGNNTYALESQLDWRGISVDNEKAYIDLWQKSDRDESGAYCLDAVQADYESLFVDNNMPEIIDYLSIDLEPPPLTLQALYKIPFDKYKFRCITFETDAYRDFGTEEPSREFLKEKGYRLIHAVKRQDDFWVYGEEI